MKTTTEWLQGKMSDYSEDQVKTLKGMLTNTNDSIEQYLQSPHLTTKHILEHCVKHNKLFLSAITNELSTPVSGSVHIDFAMYLTGHDREIVEQMFNDWNI